MRALFILLALTVSVNASESLVGRWVTYEDGQKVCRIRSEPFAAMSTTSSAIKSICADWQEPEPRDGMLLPAWIECGRRWEGCKLHTEAGWWP